MMTYIKYFFKLTLYSPLVYSLVFLYNTVAFHDLGIAIVLLTIIIRVILYPLFYKSFLNQTLLQKLQPEINRIQNDHKHDKEKQAQAMMALYKEHQVNPFTSFFLIFIQLPILIVLYNVFLHPPAELSSISLGLIDLSKSSIIIVGLAAIAQYVQTKLTLPKIKPGEEVSPATKVAKQMAIIGPALTLLILWRLPAAIGVYWLVTSLFSLLQQIYINKKIALTYDGKIKTNNSTIIGGDGV